VDENSGRHRGLLYSMHVYNYCRAGGEANARNAAAPAIGPFRRATDGRT
jgi:hypothetical protein